MRRHKQNDLLTLLQSFFRDYLERVRGASNHTIHAYRDTLRLFFLFLAQRRGGSAADLTLEDLRADNVLAFLDYVESRRTVWQNPRSSLQAGNSPCRDLS
jgi:site-specific recombinase XerD